MAINSETTQNLLKLSELRILNHQITPLHLIITGPSIFNPREFSQHHSIDRDHPRLVAPNVHLVGTTYLGGMSPTKEPGGSAQSSLRSVSGFL